MAEQLQRAATGPGSDAGTKGACAFVATQLFGQLPEARRIESTVYKGTARGECQSSLRRSFRKHTGIAQR